MDPTTILPNFSVIFHILFLFIFSYYGWVLFVIMLIAMLWHSYIKEIQHQFVHQQEWAYLMIRVPRENITSTLAVENIFNQIHAIHGGKTFAEKYTEGQDQLWFSLEIVSLGGKVSFIIRIPKKFLDLVESAIYASYPQAEISEVADYMENFHFDPYDENSQYDIFGSEWKLDQPDSLPIKTYKDFEHQLAEQKILDPLANFFEAMGKVRPHELVAYQIIIQPIADDDWHEKSLLKIKELTGEEVPHKTSFSGALMKPLEAFARFSYKDAILGGHNHGHEEEAKPRNNWTTMTDVEKERVNLIERKAGKTGYKTKIRMLYIAPKQSFDNTKKTFMVGPLRQLGSTNTNKLKPDASVTWTGAPYHYSQALEQPFIDRKVKKRKRIFFKGFKERNIHIGLPMFILNVEEIATLYHFPMTTETTLAPSSVEKTESKKSQPPVNLPVVE